ncbi:MAG: site-specific DNA-methyltransferase [Desulfobacterales bacterium]
MKTVHAVCFSNAKDMSEIPSDSIDLVVTSPPYPMIAMWDDLFGQLNPEIGECLKAGRGMQVFELMHKELDAVWTEVRRAVKSGGFICINVGNAVRTLAGNFALYPSHSRIAAWMTEAGLTPLPEILWRKQTNAPNKFMGSGMLPAGAYVTLEHEYILIFRKGPKREFKKAEEKILRRKSAYFWEERNIWFSDIWTDIRGTCQHLSDNTVRKRSAAFPFEIPWRLIQMFSVYGDTVLDPFLGSGTTLFAAMASARNSIGYEREIGFRDMLFSACDSVLSSARKRIRDRMAAHRDFVKKRLAEKGCMNWTSTYYNFPVMTAQEQELIFYEPEELTKTGRNLFEVRYLPHLPE